MLAIEPTKQAYPEGETREIYNTVLAQILPEKKTIKYYPHAGPVGILSMVQAQKDLDRAYIDLAPKYTGYKHVFFVNFTGMVSDREHTKLSPTKAAIEHVRESLKD